MNRVVCKACGYRGRPKTITKGSLGMEVILWLMMVLPGLLYSVWRHASRYSGCPQCSAPDIIPETSPVAQQLASTAPVGGVSPDQKKCPDCAEAVLAEAKKCRFCGFAFPVSELADVYNCHSCGRTNSAFNVSCMGCGARRQSPVSGERVDP